MQPELCHGSEKKNSLMLFFSKFLLWADKSWTIPFLYLLVPVHPYLMNTAGFLRLSLISCLEMITQG
jgi:hypothetical protein